MKAKCIICDKVCELDDQSPLAKRLRNRPIHTFMCHECHERISERTRNRWATGKFVLHLPPEGRNRLRS